MISGLSDFYIRKARPSDLLILKEIADQHKHELGFVLRPALSRSIGREEVLVAEDDTDLLGFVEYHHRRDEQTTLYHIVVTSDCRRQGVGKALINHLRDEARDLQKSVILLKCPDDLSAQEFYKRVGFRPIREETGKKRSLVVFVLDI